MDSPRVRIYLDGHSEPIIDQELPTDVSIDTRTLEDGPHRLTIRAQGQSGRDGVEEISFQVQNGPGIVVSGLEANSIRRGRVRFTVDAFSTDDPFDPRRAEARSSIPVWVYPRSMHRLPLTGLNRGLLRNRHSTTPRAAVIPRPRASPRQQPCTVNYDTLVMSISRVCADPRTPCRTNPRDAFMNAPH